MIAIQVCWLKLCWYASHMAEAAQIVIAPALILSLWRSPPTLYLRMRNHMHQRWQQPIDFLPHLLLTSLGSAHHVSYRRLHATCNPSCPL